MRTDSMCGPTSVGALLAGSLLPMLAGYPATHTITEVSVTAGAAIYFSLASVIMRGTLL